jgi:hypothetical protein
VTTATETAARVVSKPESERLYMARRKNQRLVKTPRYPIYGPGGRQVGEQPGETLEFRNHALRVPLKGKVRLADGREADAAEIIEWLDGHQLNGNREEGFWFVPQVAPEPTSEEIDALLTATSNHDVEALQAILAAEEAGFNRSKIVDPAIRALQNVEAINRAVDEALVKEAKEAEAAAAKPKGQAKA